MEYKGLYPAKFFSILILALLLSPVPSSQELASVRRMEDLALDTRHPLMSGSEASAHGARMLNLAQQRNGLASSFRQWAPATEGNATLESLGESLSRLEGNMASLIQSFLSLQRSVFNLEQLQELLVLLLEDILKQTGNMDRVESNGGNQPNKNAGSSESSDDSDGNRSAEADGDGDDANEDGMQNGGQDTQSGGKGSAKGNGQSTDPLLSTTERGVSENMYRDSAMGTAGRQRQNTNSIQGDDSRGSGGGSSEGGASYSAEDNSGQGPALTQEQNQQRPNTAINRPTKSQWSEPITAQTTSQIHNRFNDMVRRIASRLGSRSRVNSGPQRFGQMRLESEAHSSPPESTLDRPPSFEPLEIVPARESLSGQEKTMPETLPFHVKLRQMSQVVSHGGPLTGPEKSSTVFMENLGGPPTSEHAGERPTGMINNLVQPGNGHTPKPTGVDSLTREAVERKNPLFDIRKRRQTGNFINGQPLVQEVLSVDRLAMPRIVVSDANAKDRNKISEQGQNQEPTYSITDTPPTELNLQVSQGNIITETFPEPTFSRTTASGVYYQQTSLANGGKQKDKGIDQEYDFLIASLLKDLTNKLQTEHLKNSQGNDNTHDGVINRAINELNKLIWIPSHNQINFPNPPTTTDATTRQPFTALPNFINDQQTDSPKSTPTEVNFATPSNRQSDEEKTRQRNSDTNDKAVNNIGGNKKTEQESTIATYAISVQDNKNQTDVTVVSAEDTITTIPSSPEAPSTDSTSTTVISFTTTAPQTATTSNPWTWLRDLTPNSKLTAVDLEWLTEALAEISQLKHLTEHMQEFSDRGRHLIYKKQQINKDNKENQVDGDDENDNLNYVTGNSKDDDDRHINDDEDEITGGTLNRNNDSLEKTQGPPPALNNNIAENKEVDDYSQEESEDNILYDTVKDNRQENTIFSTFEESAESSNMVINNFRLENDVNIEESNSVSYDDVVSNYTDGLADETSELQDLDSGEDNETSALTEDEDDLSNDKNSYDSEQYEDTDDGNDSSTPQPIPINHNQESSTNAIITGNTHHSQDNMLDNQYWHNSPADNGNDNVFASMENLDKGLQDNSYEQNSKESWGDYPQMHFYSGSNQANQNMQQPQLQAPPLVHASNGYFPNSPDIHRALLPSDDYIQQMNYLNFITQGSFRKRRYAKKGKQALLNRHPRYKRQATSFWQDMFNPNPQTLQYPSQQTYPGSQAGQYSGTSSLQTPGHSIANGINTQLTELTGQNAGTNPQNLRASLDNTQQNSWYSNPYSQYQRPNSQYHNFNSQQTNRQNSLYHQNRNPHYSGQNRQFNVPIAGYPNYFSLLGLDFPGLALSGFNPLDPTELPSLDMEEILTNLFRRYWQQVNNLYTTPGIPKTTVPDLDAEEIITTTTTAPTTQALTTITSTQAVTNSTVALPETTMSSNVTSPETKNSTSVLEAQSNNNTLQAVLIKGVTESISGLKSPSETILTPP